jgi:hypothetical protein
MHPIEAGEVFDAVRRGYRGLSDASDEEILEFFAMEDAQSLTGHLANVKGILFEREYLELLHEEGVNAELFPTSNHPVSDIAILDGDGELIDELQLKASSSAGYIADTLEKIPEDVEVVTTSEVAADFPDEVIDSGISDELLDELLSETLFPVRPISILGALFGIF